jgi:hypothetical protein
VFNILTWRNEIIKNWRKLFHGLTLKHHSDTRLITQPQTPQTITTAHPANPHTHILVHAHTPHTRTTHSQNHTPTHPHKRIHVPCGCAVLQVCWCASVLARGCVRCMRGIRCVRMLVCARCAGCAAEFLCGCACLRFVRVCECAGCAVFAGGCGCVCRLC